MRVRWDEHVERKGQMTNAHRILVEKPEDNRPRGRLTLRWEDNIRMDRGEIGWEIVDWINVAQDKGQWWNLVNTVINILVP
jgi:hypothetical protein